MQSNVKEVVIGYGHANIIATHKTTAEFTKETHLSKKGDCIIAVGTDKALADLSPEFKANLTKSNAKIIISIEAGGISAQIQAYGAQEITLEHPTDAVVRKSGYICSRTLAVHADKAAIDLPRALVEKLKNPKQRVKIRLTLSS